MQSISTSALFTILMATLGAVAADFTVSTPSSLVQCQPVLISWTGGTAPYYPEITKAGDVSTIIKSFAETSTTSVSWTVDLTIGEDVTIVIVDSTGATAISGTTPATSAGTSSTCTNTASTAESTSATSTAATSSSKSKTTDSTSSTKMSSSSAATTTSASKSTTATSSAATTTTTTANSAFVNQQSVLGVAGGIAFVFAVLF
ncbi:hypothetical protein CBS101457_006068 [Exobasidium rhododendri]|nr:hypothetical protein CBS101457_006068 [Exobasidium rhododendri]